MCLSVKMLLIIYMNWHWTLIEEGWDLQMSPLQRIIIIIRMKSHNQEKMQYKLKVKKLLKNQCSYCVYESQCGSIVSALVLSFFIAWSKHLHIWHRNNFMFTKIFSSTPVTADHMTHILCALMHCHFLIF